MNDLNFGDMRLVCDLSRMLRNPRSFKNVALELRAQGLNFTATSLGRHIHSIEAKMGMKPGFLVCATPGRGSIVTDEGHDAARIFEELIATYDRDITSKNANRRACVDVGMTHSASSHFISAILKEGRFLPTWPNTDLQVVEGYPDELQDRVLNLQIHFCVGPKVSALKGIVVEPLCDWNQVLFFRKDVPEFKGLVDCLEIEDDARRESVLLGCLRAVIVLIPLSRVANDVQDWLKPPTTGNIHRMPQATIRYQLAHQGAGVALGYREPLLGLYPDSRMGMIDLPQSFQKIKVCIYRRGNDQKVATLPPEAEGLIQAIRDQFGQPPMAERAGRGFSYGI